LETVVNKLYEGMFLIDSAKAASDWDGVNATIKNILEKAEAEIVSIRKWDERKLAYKIGGKIRGTYILCYFRADGRKIQDIERDVQLSEQIMRVLILSAECMGQEDIEKSTPAMLAEKQSQKSAQETKAKQATVEEKAEQVAALSQPKQQESSEPEAVPADDADEQTSRETRGQS